MLKAAAEKYLAIIKLMEKQAADYEESRRSRFESDCQRERSTGGRPNRCFGVSAQLDADKRDEILAVVRQHRSYFPYVEAGLITVADALREIGRGNTADAIRSVGPAIAEPGHIRIKTRPKSRNQRGERRTRSR